MAVSDLTQARLKELVSYDPDTGVFIWIKKANRNILIGSVAGSVNSQGYWRIQIDQKSYRAHKLAWLYIFGEFPNGILDHKNRDKLDNRISNLRSVSSSINNQNCKIRKNNTSGSAGVHLDKSRQKWVSYVKIDSKHKHIGYFNTIEEAIAARKAAEKKFYSLPD
jgi:hypothetical protein